MTVNAMVKMTMLLPCEQIPSHVHVMLFFYPMAICLTGCWVQWFPGLQIKHDIFSQNICQGLKKAVE